MARKKTGTVPKKEPISLSLVFDNGEYFLNLSCKRFFKYWVSFEQSEDDDLNLYRALVILTEALKESIINDLFDSGYELIRKKETKCT